MKTKKFDKKLVLNKKTIAHLGSGEMKKAQGGGTVQGDCSFMATCWGPNSRCTSFCPLVC